MNSNKIKNTKVGDDIHFYINGVEDRGIVVKMNNEYVTVFKESTQNYDDIHINDTFFVKDIMVNKEWDRCTDQERFDMLQKAHAPSPRYLMKTWDELPRDIKEVLRKNNGIETSHKETDDMNNVTRLNDEKTETNKVEKGDSGGRKFGEGSTLSEDPEQAPNHKQGEKHRKETVATMDPHGIADEHGGKRGVTSEESAKLERHNQDGAANVRNQERSNTGEKKEWEKFTGGRKDPALQGDKDKLKLIRGKISERKERKENQSDKVPKKVTEGVSALKAWQLWLAQRQEQVIKDAKDGKGGSTPHPKYGRSHLRTDNTGLDSTGGTSASSTSNLRDHGTEDGLPRDYELTSEGKNTRNEKGLARKRRTSRPTPSRTSHENKETGGEPQTRVEQSDETAYDDQTKQHNRIVDNTPEEVKPNRLPEREGKGALGKSIEEKLLELKSNVENSVHGNAARNPTSGVNTNTSFDAPKDYEGASHSGIRSEQFKYEDKKPSVGQKLSKVNIKIDGNDKPTKLTQGTGDNGNAYNTKQQNEQKQGRADNQEGDKKQ
jgi:hypothetical protein